MLGRNHALYAGAAWAAAWPYLGWAGADTTDAALFAMSTGIAAGSGVIPDLDHPDARPSKHFGILTSVVSKAIESASGGHRLGTHSFVFVALIGAVTQLTTILPGDWARIAAAAACSFCVSVGVTLVGPSLGMRVPPAATMAATLLPAWYAWSQYETLAPLLWLLASGGTLCHILCDIVTKGGVPVLWPFTKRRVALGMFRVGGPGEAAASALGVLAFVGAFYQSSLFLAA